MNFYGESYNVFDNLIEKQQENQYLFTLATSFVYLYNITQPLPI